MKPTIERFGPGCNNFPAHFFRFHTQKLSLKSGKAGPNLSNATVYKLIHRHDKKGGGSTGYRYVEYSRVQYSSVTTTTTTT